MCRCLWKEPVEDDRAAQWKSVSRVLIGFIFELLAYIFAGRVFDARSIKMTTHKKPEKYFAPGIGITVMLGIRRCSQGRIDLFTPAGGLQNQHHLRHTTDTRTQTQTH